MVGNVWRLTVLNVWHVYVGYCLKVLTWIYETPGDKNVDFIRIVWRQGQVSRAYPSVCDVGFHETVSAKFGQV
jgi:hypothetical protein